MNPEILLEKVAEAIQTREVSSEKRWAICWFGGRIQCKPIIHVKDDGNLFGTFMTDELNNGLTNEQWDRLLYKIATFFERVKL